MLPYGFMHLIRLGTYLCADESEQATIHSCVQSSGQIRRSPFLSGMSLAFDDRESLTAYFTPRELGVS